jgi:hypothetical protein
MCVCPGQRVSNDGHVVSTGGQRVSVAGQNVTPAGHCVSVGGQRVSPAGQWVRLGGQRVSVAGQRVSATGQWVSAAGQRVSLTGQLVSTAGQRVSATGQWVSPAGHCVSVGGQCVSPAGQRVSDPDSVSAGGQRVSAAGHRVKQPGSAFRSGTESFAGRAARVTEDTWSRRRTAGPTGRASPRAASINCRTARLRRGAFVSTAGQCVSPDGQRVWTTGQAFPLGQRVSRWTAGLDGGQKVHHGHWCHGRAPGIGGRQRVSATGQRASAGGQRVSTMGNVCGSAGTGFQGRANCFGGRASRFAGRQAVAGRTLGQAGGQRVTQAGQRVAITASTVTRGNTPLARAKTGGRQARKPIQRTRHRLVQRHGFVRRGCARGGIDGIGRGARMDWWRSTDFPGPGLSETWRMPFFQLTTKEDPEMPTAISVGQSSSGSRLGEENGIKRGKSVVGSGVGLRELLANPPATSARPARS